MRVATNRSHYLTVILSSLLASACLAASADKNVPDELEPRNWPAIARAGMRALVSGEARG